MLTLPDSKRSSTNRKHDPLHKKSKHHKNTKQNSEIHVSKASNLDSSVHNLVPTSHKEKSEQCELQLAFYPDSLPIKHEPHSTFVEYARVPVIKTEIQQESLINDPDLSTSADSKPFFSYMIPRNENEIPNNSPRLKEEEEDPLLIEEPVDNPLDCIEQIDISGWVKKFTSLPLFYTKTGIPYTKCPACAAVFFKVIPFQNHLLCHFHRHEDLLICSYCRFASEVPSEFFSHLLVHQDQCEACNVNLTGKNSFEKHYDESKFTFTIKRDHLGGLICVICNLGFDLPHQLRKHWFKHICNAPKAHQCNCCQAILHTGQLLENHKCLKCPICSKSYDSFQRLKAHTRYEKHCLFCSICNYEFILGVDYEKHLKLHEKNYRLHKKYKHCLIAEDKSSFQCELCGMIFLTESRFLVHFNNNHDTIKIHEDVGENEIDNMEQTMRPKTLEIINLQGGLVCEEVNLEEACGQMLVNVTEKQKENLEETNDLECKPVALCWRYPRNQLNVMRTT